MIMYAGPPGGVELLVIWAMSTVCGVPCAIGAVFLAKAKGRRPWVWALLCLFFNVIALIVLAGLPSRHTQPSAFPVEPMDEHAAR